MSESSPEHGYAANHPRSIPWRGWWDIIRRVWRQTNDDNLSLVAAGVTFYFLLAFFPALGALISIYGLFVAQQEVGRHFSDMLVVLPAETHQLILTQIQRFVDNSETTLSLGAISSTLLAVWSTSKGAQAIIIACNIAYKERRTRGFLRQLLVRVLFTIAAIGFILLALAVIALLPTMVSLMGLNQYQDWLLKIVFWPLLLLFFHAALIAIYRYGPTRENAKWRWITPGSILATCFWLLASGLFSFYLANFGRYDETYGSLGGVVILLMWLYLSAFIILLGAKFNAALELQTERDTTVGAAQEIGERGAYVADHVERDSKNSM